MKADNRNTKAGKLPYTLINMAMSADGKIATANRKISSFGSRRDHDRLLKLRATADCVITGAGTVNSNKINLGPGGLRYREQRLQRGLTEYNRRVVVSGSGNVNPKAEVFQHRFSPVIVLTTDRIPAEKLRALESVSDAVRVCGETEIDFVSAFEWLRREWKVQRLLCEGGGVLNDAVLRADLVDEIYLTICPLLIGGVSSPTIADGLGVDSLAVAHQYEIKKLDKINGEMFVSFRRKHAPEIA